MVLHLYPSTGFRRPPHVPGMLELLVITFPLKVVLCFVFRRHDKAFNRCIRFYVKLRLALMSDSTARVFWLKQLAEGIASEKHTPVGDDDAAEFLATAAQDISIFAYRELARQRNRARDRMVKCRWRRF